MTSKENIELIKQLYEYAMYDFHCGKLNEMTKKDKAVGKAIEQIEQDLEVLEIFKSLGFELQTTILGNNLFFSAYLKSALLTEEQYTKLKEWSGKNELDISHRKLTDDELDILYKIYSFKWE